MEPPNDTGSRVVAGSGGGYGFEADAMIAALSAVEDTLIEAGVSAGCLRCGCLMGNLFRSLPAIKGAGALKHLRAARIAAKPEPPSPLKAWATAALEPGFDPT